MERDRISNLQYSENEQQIIIEKLKLLISIDYLLSGPNFQQVVILLTNKNLVDILTRHYHDRVDRVKIYLI